MHVPKLILSLALALSLPACFGGRALEVREYLLVPVSETPDVAAAPAAAELEAGPWVGVSPIAFSAYLRRPGIVTREANQIRSSVGHRWAESLAPGFTRVLVQNLRLLVPTERVASFPWPEQVDFTVDMEVKRFERTGDDAIVLEAIWLVRDRGGRQLTVRTDFLERELEDDDYGSAVVAMSDALGELSRLIASEIQRHPVGTTPPPAAPSGSIRATASGEPAG